MKTDGGWKPPEGSISTADPTAQLDIPRPGANGEGNGGADVDLPGLPGEGGRAPAQVIPLYGEAAPSRVPMEAGLRDDDRSVLFRDSYGSHPLRSLYAIIDGNDRARERERAFMRGGIYLLSIEALLVLIVFLVWKLHA